MSILEQARTAEEKMHKAQRALLAFVALSPVEPENVENYRGLAEALIEAAHEYVRLVLELDSEMTYPSTDS